MHQKCVFASIWPYQDGSNSGGSDEEFDNRKNDFSADGCSNCSSY